MGRLRFLGVVALFAVACGLKSSEGAVEKEDDAAIIAKQVARYPLGACVISGKALGYKGKPVNHLHKGRLVRFCCKDCIPAFEKSPDSYLAKIDEAARVRWRSLAKERPAKGTAQKAGCGCSAGKSCGNCATKAKPGCGSGCSGCSTKPKSKSGCGSCGAGKAHNPKPASGSGCSSCR